MEVDADIKKTKIDSRHRITIPKEYIQYFPGQSEVVWRFDGKRIVVSFEQADHVEFLTQEFLMNQIHELRKEMKKLESSLSELRRGAFMQLMKGPE